MKDRNGKPINVGDAVRLIAPMGVDGHRDGKIASTNGEYIYVEVMIAGKPIEAERYWCEMEKA